MANPSSFRALFFHPTERIYVLLDTLIDDARLRADQLAAPNKRRDHLLVFLDLDVEHARSDSIVGWNRSSSIPHPDAAADVKSFFLKIELADRAGFPIRREKSRIG
jgi:hypothetical protein